MGYRICGKHPRETRYIIATVFHSLRKSNPPHQSFALDFTPLRSYSAKEHSPASARYRPDTGMLILPRNCYAFFRDSCPCRARLKNGSLKVGSKQIGSLSRPCGRIAFCCYRANERPPNQR